MKTKILNTAKTPAILNTAIAGIYLGGLAAIHLAGIAVHTTDCVARKIKGNSKAADAGKHDGKP